MVEDKKGIFLLFLNDFKERLVKKVDDVTVQKGGKHST